MKLTSKWTYPGGDRGKESAANAGEIQVWSLGREDLLEEGMATHPSILAWRIPWAEPEGLQFIGSQRVKHNWSDLAHMHHLNQWISVSRLPSIIWVGLTQPPEGLSRTKRPVSPSKREFSSRLPSDFFCILVPSRSPDCQPTLQILDLPESTLVVRQSLITNLLVLPQWPSGYPSVNTGVMVSIPSPGNKIPFAHRATKPMYHNYWTLSLQLLKPACPWAHVPWEKPLQYNWRVAPACHN